MISPKRMLTIYLTVLSAGAFGQSPSALKVNPADLGEKNEWGFYSYKTDSGNMAMNEMGEAIYPYAYREIIQNDLETEAFVVTRGDGWGFFSIDGKYNFPLSNVGDGWSVFNIDSDYSYANLNTNYIVFQNEKYGLVNANYVTLMPFVYSTIYDLNFDNLAIGKQQDSWDIVDLKKDEVVHQLALDRWIGTKLINEKRYGLFVRHDSLIFLSFDDYTESSGLNACEKSNEFIAIQARNQSYGAVNSKGDIILPFEFEHLNVHIEENRSFNSSILLHASFKPDSERKMSTLCSMT